MNIVISLDIGTSKLCALAFDPKIHKVLATCSMPNDTDIKNLAPELHEQDPQQIFHKCFDLIQTLLSKISALEVIAIAISGQMHGVLLINQQLEPITNLITWRDQRTAKILSSLKLNASIFKQTGCKLSSGYGGATLAWLNANHKITSNMRAVTIADYLTASLTGIITTEPTHAASWGIFDLTKGCWHKALIATLNIPEFVLPQVVPTAKPIGPIAPQQAKILGLSEQVQVCTPIGDNQASVIGSIGLATDSAVINVGTGGQISIPITKYAYTEQLETRPMPFKGYIQVGASLCGGWAHAYLKDFFYKVIKDIADIELDNATIYKKINHLALQAQPGATGLLADTRFSGTRLEPNVLGSINNIDRNNLTPHNLARAFMEGIINELLDFSHHADLTNIKKIVASGNAVRKNSSMQQVITKIFNRPCHIKETTEEAALGAAYAAASGLGLIAK